MKSDIILSGVGGQGILSVAAIIGLAAINNGLFIKQSEVHGMSQRGGAVQSHLRISGNEIASDLIPIGQADLIISVEPMESLRYLPYLNEKGWLITNTQPFININDYPSLDLLISEIEKVRNYIKVDADKIAGEIGALRSSNILILGVASPFVNIHVDYLLAAVEQIFRQKGQPVVDMNIKAFLQGRKIGEMYIN